MCLSCFVVVSSCGPDSYKGDWVKDTMAGSGVYTFASGAVYRGSFANNQFNGAGEYQFADNAVYR